MKTDMSPAAVTRRLKRVSELRRLCRALAGPRRALIRTPGQSQGEGTKVSGTVGFEGGKPGKHEPGRAA